VLQSFVLCVQNALKLTYEHLAFLKKILGSLSLATRGGKHKGGGGGEGRGGRGKDQGREGGNRREGREGEGSEGKGREGKKGEGRMSPQNVSHGDANELTYVPSVRFKSILYT
jgi:hypothetical protein